MKITIIGAGHMGRAIAWGLAEGSIVSAKDITCTAQTFSTLQKVQMKGHRDIVALRDNVQAVQEADMVLLDAGMGSGRTFDWSLLEGMERDYILSGGLDPDNISEALDRYRPFGVDVSSGIETDGRKDPAKMAAFLNAARHT